MLSIDISPHALSKARRTMNRFASAAVTSRPAHILLKTAEAVFPKSEHSLDHTAMAVLSLQRNRDWLWFFALGLDLIGGLCRGDESPGW